MQDPAFAGIWLQAQSRDIEIVGVLDGYARLAGEFDKWLHDPIGAKYAAEIQAYEEAAEAFDREWDRAFGLRPR